MLCVWCVAFYQVVRNEHRHTDIMEARVAVLDKWDSHTPTSNSAAVCLTKCFNGRSQA